MKQLFFVLLYPFAILYDLGSRLRNHLYNIKYKRSFQFAANVVAVGNLSMGGSGKTPVVEYLLRLLNDRKVATLSRGYGRKTKGFRIANQQDDATTLGDEPFQFYKKFPRVMVAVGEDRMMAIPQIICHQKDTDNLKEEQITILLDDAYQHRSVTANLNILLTEFDRPFFKDYILPAGRLREARKNANRADVVIVTKCPDHIDEPVEKQYQHHINTYTKPSTPVFFSKIVYKPPRLCFGKAMENFKQVFVFTGIANQRPLIEYAQQQYEVVGTRHYPDHYQYKRKDVAQIVAQYDKVKSPHSVLLTTEKDMVKLLNDTFRGLLGRRSLYYLPIEVAMIKNGEIFDQMINDCASKK